MMHLLNTLLVAVSSASFSSAHFLLTYPKPIAYNYEDSKLYPCGSFDITNRKPNITDFHIGGSPISVNTTHDVSIWMFRAALLEDVVADKENFDYTDIAPTIRSTGASGHFCEPSVSVPKKYEGKEGVIQVIQKAPGGALLYACAAVKFKSGSYQGDLPPLCNNATGTEAEVISTSIPVPLPTESTQASDEEGTSNPTGTVSGASSTETTDSSGSSIRGSGAMFALVVALGGMALEILV